jgi:hypothetical protein
LDDEDFFQVLLIVRTEKTPIMLTFIADRNRKTGTISFERSCEFYTVGFTRGPLKLIRLYSEEKLLGDIINVGSGDIRVYKFDGMLYSVYKPEDTTELQQLFEFFDEFFFRTVLPRYKGEKETEMNVSPEKVFKLIKQIPSPSNWRWCNKKAVRYTEL